MSHEHEIAVATGAEKQPDGSISVTLKAVGLNKDEAIALIDLLRETVRVFSIITGGATVGMTKCNAGSVDEAIAVFHSRDATKQ